LYTTEIT